MTSSRLEPEQLPGPLSPHPTRMGGVGGTAMSAPQVRVGIDVSKAQLDVARSQDAGWPVNNDDSGIAGLVERLRPLSPPWSSWRPPAGWRCR